MKPHKKKQAFTQIQAEAKKTVYAEQCAQCGSVQDKCPTWRTEAMDLDGAWGWHKVTREEALRVHERLKTLERMTWQELLQGQRTSNHPIKIDKIIPEARRRLEELKHDTEELISLEITGVNRVWGIRIGQTLRLLWWDPEHEVCPSRKRHT